MRLPTIDHSYASADAVVRSARASLAAQVVLGLITAAAVFVPIDKGSEHDVLQSIAILETASQGIEFVYYALVVFYFHGIRTWTRYADWFVSTPTMLVSIMTFLLYLQNRDDGEDTSILDLFHPDYLGATLPVLCLNALMLVFGLLVELSVFPMRTGLILGTACFMASFGTIYVGYARASGTIGFGLYMFTYIVWSGYGIAATLPPISKNVAYNTLDVVSKNCYGVFLFIFVMTLR